MRLRNLILTSIAAVGLAAGSASADRERIAVHPHHIVVKERFGHHNNTVVRERFGRNDNVVVRDRVGGRTFIAHDRVIEVLRARHIRYIGAPYIYGGQYVVRCYDNFGRLSYCSVDPYSGAFIGFKVRL